MARLPDLLFRLEGSLYASSWCSWRWSDVATARLHSSGGQAEAPHERAIGWQCPGPRALCLSLVLVVAHPPRSSIPKGSEYRRDQLLLGSLAGTTLEAWPDTTSKKLRKPVLKVTASMIATAATAEAEAVLPGHGSGRLVSPGSGSSSGAEMGHGSDELVRHGSSSGSCCGRAAAGHGSDGMAGLGSRKGRGCSRAAAGHSSDRLVSLGSGSGSRCSRAEVEHDSDGLDRPGPGSGSSFAEAPQAANQHAVQPVSLPARSPLRSTNSKSWPAAG